MFESDLAATISDELSLAFSVLLKDPDVEQPTNLRVAYKVLRRSLLETLVADGRIEPDAEDVMLAEMQELIEEHGGDTLVQDFVRARVSRTLTVVIQAALDGEVGMQAATLGELREAIAQGLAAQLVGMGEIDADDDETLSGELQALIAEYGEDAPIEGLLP